MTFNFYWLKNDDNKKFDRNQQTFLKCTNCWRSWLLVSIVNDIIINMDNKILYNKRYNHRNGLDLSIYKFLRFKVNSTKTATLFKNNALILNLSNRGEKQRISWIKRLYLQIYHVIWMNIKLRNAVKFFSKQCFGFERIYLQIYHIIL